MTMLIICNANNENTPPNPSLRKSRNGVLLNDIRASVSSIVKYFIHDTKSVTVTGVTNCYSFNFLNLNAFAITETELNVIAALAIIGESRMPSTGNTTPAAIGTPTML